MHLNAKTAFNSAIRIKVKGKWYIFISARLPFGGLPCPNYFCLLSDIITDTIIDLLACEDWNHQLFCSDYIHKIPKAKRLNKDVPFSQARE